MNQLTSDDLSVIQHRARAHVHKGLAHHDVDDVAQDAALSAWTSSLPEQPEHRRAVLRVIVDRRVADHHRHLLGRVHHRPELGHPDEALSVDSGQPHVGHAHELLDALGQLPASQARTAVLRALGYTQSEVARAEGITHYGVADRQRKVRRALNS